jgi:long-chain acyl-CoA synthetase
MMHEGSPVAVPWPRLDTAHPQVNAILNGETAHRFGILARMNGALVYSGVATPYAEVAARAGRAAQGCAEAGVAAGGTIAVMLRNHPAFIEAMLAARHLGAYWCSINWHFRAEETGYILADCGAKCFLVGDEMLEAVSAAVPQGVRVIPLSAWDRWRDSHACHTVPAARPGNPMMYTSGTTGRPKGVKRYPSVDPAAQARMAADVWSEVYALAPGARALMSAPLYHSAPNAYAMQAVLRDATLHLEAKFDAERTLALIHEERITHAYLVPTMFSRMLKLPESVKRRYDLSSMQFVVSMGSPCAPEVKRAMIEWWGPVIHESYAASELGIVSFVHAGEALSRPGTAGRPVGGAQIRILDDAGREVPTGEVGLIYARQPATPDFTYLNNEASRRAIERDGLISLGDMGYLDADGYLYICDRAVDMVISGGVNIYPAEIESVLVGMPGVADCAVFGIPDAEFGESLAAAVQPMPGAALDAAQVQAWLRERIAAYKVPRTVAFHAELPREDSGKIFKRRLRDPYWQAAGRRI